MLDNLQLFRIVSLYVGIIGIALGGMNFLICVLLHAINWHPHVAKRITGILTFIATLSIALALTGIGAWVWTDGLEASALSELPPWSVEFLNMLLIL